MKMTIGKKLSFSFLGLASLVLISGIVGIIILFKVTNSADTVGKGKAPVQYSVLNAALALEKLQKFTVEYNSATIGLHDLEEKLISYLDEFDMWISMLQNGTDSKEFKSSKSGSLYTAKGLTVTTPKGSLKIKQVTEKILQESSNLKTNTNDLIKAHKEYASYSVIAKDGKIYPLPSFLNLTQRQQTEWVQQLKDAAGMEAVFAGETTPKGGLLGEWLSSYKVENQDLMKLVEQLSAQIEKVRNLAAEVNKKTSGADKNSTFLRTITTTSRIERYFQQLHTLSETLYNNLETTEHAKQAAMTASAETINKALTSLITDSAQEMKDALKISDATKKSGTTTLILLTLAAVIIAAVMGTLMSRYLSRRIHTLADATRDIAHGNLQKKVEKTSSDELGELADDTNTMIDNLREMIGQIRNFSENLSDSSTGLGGVSQDLDKNAMDLGTKSTDASHSTEMMTSSILDISTIANDSMERVQSVAMATEEMSATIKEIAGNAEQARSVTAKAVTTVEKTTAKMTELSEAAKEVGKVADVIVNIADQTNLLSLNATIEAARAGDAGKGFAVVANEVKELAKQTAKATEDISQKIAAIQTDTKRAVEAIATIGAIINQINDISSTIATAVEEQSATTNEMSRNVTEAAKGSTEITQNIAGVSQAAQGTSSSAQESMKAAQALAQMSAQLRGLVEQFKVTGDGPVNGHSR
jgi:methyl-accepting chemotaxis protein